MEQSLSSFVTIRCTINDAVEKQAALRRVVLNFDSYSLDILLFICIRLVKIQNEFNPLLSTQ